MSEVTITENNFNSEIVNYKGFALIDFYADWCGPCKMMAPSLEKMSTLFTGKIKICKVNVDEAQAVAQQFGIQSIPTIIFFKDGQMVDVAAGFQSEENLKRKIEQVLEK